MTNEEEIIKLLKEHSKTLARIENLLTSKKSKTPPLLKKASITQQKKMTVPAFLVLLKEDKFFDQPRTLKDISKKLKEESRNVPVTSLTLPLQRLVRSRQLARVLQDGKWSYVRRD